MEKEEDRPKVRSKVVPVVSKATKASPPRSSSPPSKDSLKPPLSPSQEEGEVVEPQVVSRKGGPRNFRKRVLEEDDDDEKKKDNKKPEPTKKSRLSDANDEKSDDHETKQNSDKNQSKNITKSDGKSKDGKSEKNDKNGSISDAPNDIAKFDVQKWYDSVKDLTCKTGFDPLTIKEAELIVAYYEGKESRDSQGLLELQQRLHRWIGKFCNENRLFEKGLFLRLSRTSPKDAWIKSPKMRKAVSTELSTIFSRRKYSDNDKVIEALRVCNKYLRVLTGEDAVELLINSRRVYDDLVEQLKHPNEYNVQLVAREWHDIPLEKEFRAFVYDQHLNGVSQYYPGVYFSDLSKNREETEDQIERYIKKTVMKKLTMSNYAIDVAVVNGLPMIIDINPFDTDGRMFRGRDGRNDRRQLERGPLHFRIQKEERRDVFVFFSRDLEKLARDAS